MLKNDSVQWPYYPQAGGQTKLWENLHPESNTRYLGYGGPRGIGKSFGMRSWVATLCSQMPIYAVIVRQELEDLKRNHIEPMKQELKEFIDRKMIRYNTQNKEFIFPNGSKLGFLYCKNDADLNRFQGLSIDFLGLEEAGQFTQAQIAYMISSVRSSPIAQQNNTQYSPRVLFTFNWGGPGHKFLRKHFWDGQYVEHVDKPADMSMWDLKNENPDEWKFIFGRFEENKALIELDPKYQDKLRLLSDKLQKAYIDGDPDAFTGTFFNIASFVHEVDPFEIPDTWVLFGGLDPGTASYCSFGLYAKSPDGKIVKIFNYYEKERTPVEHARAIKSLLTYDPRVVRWTGGGMPQWIAAGRDAFARQSRFSIQSHEYTWQDVFLAEGMYLTPCNNNRVQGATALLQVLSYEYDYDNKDAATDEEKIIRYPDLRFFKGQCDDTISELIALGHDEKNPDDTMQGLGVDDHAFDESKYAVLSALRPRPATFESVVGDDDKIGDYGRNKEIDELFDDAVSLQNDEDAWENMY